MRIAMICEAWYPLWGGGQEHTLRLAEALATYHGCTVTIYTMNLGDGGPTPTHPRVTVKRVGRKTTFSYLNRLRWMLKVMHAVWNEHHRASYDLIHAHSNLPGIPGKLLRYLLQRPIVYTVHGANFMEQKKKNSTALVETLLLTKIKYDREISVTRQFLRYPNRNKPVFIPNGVTTTSPPGHRAKRDPHSPFQLLFVGRLDPVKGIPTLLDAVRLLKKIPLPRPVHLRIVGGGRLEQTLRQTITDYGLANSVTLAGQLPQETLPALYAAADLFVLPSYSEGFPLTILEAWAAKLPVLVTDVGDNKLLVSDATGYVVPAHDPVALSGAIHNAMRNPLLPAMGQAGYQNVQAQYTWPAVAARTMAVYSAAQPA